MPRAFAEIAFTPAVREIQESRGSARGYDKLLGPGAEPADRMGPEERAFAEARDGFYQVLAYVGDKARGINPVRLEFGTVRVRMEPGEKPQRLTLIVDPEQIQPILDELAQREAAK